MLRRGPGPADARAIADQALGELSGATGFTFRFTGETDRVITPESHEDDRTVAIAWATPDEVSDLEGTVAGIGGPTYRWSDGEDPRPASGFAIVDASEDLSPAFTDGASEGAVLLHELGHVFGLAHVDDPNRTMAPSTNPDISGHYQPGDLAALAAAVDPRPCG